MVKGIAGQYETERLIVVPSMVIHDFISASAVQEFQLYEKDEDYMNANEDTTITFNPVSYKLAINHNKRK